jgi:GntR family transcriptional regulator
VIRVDTTSFVPIYEQIKTEIVRLVAAGVLKPGAPLPSIRDLATEILVNPNTVARAYRELEREGLISTRQGSGSFVSAEARADVDEERKAYLGRIFDAAVAEAGTFGLGAEDILKLFEERLRAAGRGGRKGGRHE